jgi:hypothetical protein
MGRGVVESGDLAELSLLGMTSHERCDPVYLMDVAERRSVLVQDCL